MGIEHTCTNPQCRHVMTLSEAFVGTMSRCPACGTVQRILAPAPPPERPAPTATSDALDQLGLIDALSDIDAPDDPAQQEPIALDKPPAQPDLADEPLEQPDLADEPQTPPGLVDIPTPDGQDAQVRPYARVAQPAEQESLASRSSMLIILALGVAGSVAGFAIGMFCFRPLGLLPAYVGAGVGWLVGFAYGLVAVFGMAREDTLNLPLGALARRTAVVCRKCGQTLQIGTVRCPSCGSTGVIAKPTTVTGGSLHALSYATENIETIVLLMMLFVAADVCSRVLTVLLPSLYSFTQLQMLGIASGAVTIKVIAWAYLFRYCLYVTAKSLSGSDNMPALPGLNIFKIIAAAIRCLGIVVFYILPVVTIPLLPLGVLAMAYANDARAYNVFWAARIAVRRPRELAVVWLILLVWAAGMAVGIAVVATLAFKFASMSLCQDDRAGVMVSMGISAIAWGLMATVLIIFLTALFRCVGMLGRFNQIFLSTLPPMRGLVRVGLSLLVLGALAGVVYLALAPHFPPAA